jgi:hypothetical protein
LALSNRTVTALTIGLLLLGLLWRTVRFLLQFPIWGDEAMLAVNLVWFDYGQLVQRLENCQIAPLLFLWGEKTAFRWLGPEMLSMRLLPFLAGIASLGLYWRLSTLLLEPHARLSAIGFLAVAIWPVSMTTVIKPYSCDLFASLVLSVLAVQWLQAPDRTRYLLWLTVVAPLLLLTSYPAMLVAGGISITLLSPVWRQGWRARLSFAAYNIAALAGSLTAVYIGNNHLSVSDGNATTQAGMISYWASDFPPASPLAFLGWLVMETTGQMAAYPVGAARGGSTLTVLLCLAGVIFWIRQRQWSYLALFGSPLLLNILAAALRRYPYGASGRLSQHLAPGFCILAGLGLARLIEKAPRALTKLVLSTTALFFAVGLVGVSLDLIYPYRLACFAWMRDTMKEIRAQIPGTDTVVVCGDPKRVEAVFVWYWLQDGSRVAWNGEPPPAARCSKELWGFHEGPGADAACEQLREKLRGWDAGWNLVRRVVFTYRPRTRRETPERCELFLFARS